MADESSKRGNDRPEGSAAARANLKARDNARGATETRSSLSNKSGALPGGGSRGREAKGHGGGGGRISPAGMPYRGGSRSKKGR